MLNVTTEVLVQITTQSHLEASSLHVQSRNFPPFMKPRFSLTCSVLTFDQKLLYGKSCVG